MIGGTRTGGCWLLVTYVREHCREPRVSAEGAGFDGSDREVKTGGDLFVREAVVMLQPHDRSFLFGQLCEGPANLPHPVKVLRREIGCCGRRMIRRVRIERAGPAAGLTSV